MSRARRALRLWTTAGPLLALVALVLTFGGDPERPVLVVDGVLLCVAVLAAVYHAEVVAHRIGEPFGSLVLAVSVTIIEVGLIVTLMVSGGPRTAPLARDTVFAAIMLTVNGIVGAVLLIGSLRKGVTSFNAEGTGTALGTVLALATLSLVLPSFTQSRRGPEFTSSQLAFAAVASLSLYALFVVVQTVRHRDHFLPAVDMDDQSLDEVEQVDDGATNIVRSFGLLFLALVAVVGLAKVESSAIEDAVSALGAHESAVGVVIAVLVLAPETLAAIRNARRDRVQVGLNLALGSAMASIGLTIPAIAVASIWLEGPLVLGLGSTQIVLLAITAVTGILTVVPGRATLQQGGVHLVLCAAFIVLAFAP